MDEKEKEPEKEKEIPLSYQKLKSRVTGPVGYRQWEFTDSRGRKYRRDEEGTITRIKD